MYSYTFTCISPLVKTFADNEGNEHAIIVKKNAYYKSTFYLDDIRGVQELFTNEGGINKIRCCIFHREKGDIVVHGSADKIRRIVFDRKGYEDTPQRKKMGYAVN